MPLENKDTVDIYDDRSELVGENISIEAFVPFRNPYMKKVLDFFKRTAIVDLSILEECLSSGRAGWATTVGKDEIKMPWYGRDLPVVENAGEIAGRIRDIIGRYGDGEEVVESISEGRIFVRIPKEIMEASASRDPTLTWTTMALAQAMSETFDINAENDPDGCNMLNAAIYGRYPQSPEIHSGGPVSGFLKQSNTIDGLGSGYKGIRINDMAALANKRTMDAVALTTILQQGAQWEMGNALGWFERYQLLASAYQGFNANNLVLEFVKENNDGTIGDVALSTVRRAVEDGVIRVRETFPSGYKIYGTDDYSLWNAYSCAGALAAVIVNVGASRAAQSASTVLAYFGDQLVFETGGLSDPDAGRMAGTGISFAFYTHSIYGGAGPGAYTLDHVIPRHTSGLFGPAVVASMCLDSGTQLFSPEMTSKGLFEIGKKTSLLHDPIRKTAESTKEM